MINLGTADRWRLPDGTVVGMAEAEQLLVGAVERCEAVLGHALRELVTFYTESGRPKRAVAPADRLVRLTDDPEAKATALLRLGLLRERLGEFEDAACAYTTALSLEPGSPEIAYWLHNNLGYSLCQVGRYADAEAHCRAALATDPRRHNAHKNLGLALAGQGKPLEAAEAFMAATDLNPRDARALAHLEELVREQPALLRQNPGLARAGLPGFPVASGESGTAP